MDLDEFKKTWKHLNHQPAQQYSETEIDAFRTSRSKDFSNWIRSSIRTDFYYKSVLCLAFIALAILFNNQYLVSILSGIIAIAILFLILATRPYYRRSQLLDQNVDNLQSGLITKLTFLKSSYFRIQFLVGLSNPLLVAAGGLFYYYSKYGQVPPLSLEDYLVFTAVLIVAFLFTIPTTAGLYGFHLRNLQNSLAGLDDADHWSREMTRHKKSKRILSIVFLSLFIIGLIALVLILLR